jgi:hypothetical protein
LKKFKSLFILLFFALQSIGQNTSIKEVSKSYANQKVLTKNEKVKYSPFATYYFFEKEIFGIPIYGETSKIVESFSGEIPFEIKPNNQKNTYSIDNLKQFNSLETIKKLLPDNIPYKLDSIYYYHQNELIPAFQINYSKNATHFKELIVDQSGEILSQRDLLKYHKADTTFNVWVHLPDPLTSSNTEYGDSISDNLDSNSVFLENQLFKKSLNLDLNSNGEILTQNKHVSIKEFSTPNIPPNVYVDSIPKFTRNQSGFEDFNVIYHISNFKDYLDQLGYGNLVNYTIDVDAHGFNGADQSSFNSFNSTPRLTFGTGGVDDAEDADVIIHEFGHAIYNSISPNAQNGSERAAFEESFGDYLAASYSRKINPFNWHQIFNWDGHNEFWLGRIANSNKFYPNDLKNNIYTDGEMFTGALMEIWEKLGAETTDKLIIESVYSHINNITLSDAAKFVVFADDLINKGANRNEICNVFIGRGFLQTCPSVGLDEIEVIKELEIYAHQKNVYFNKKINLPLVVKIYNSLGQELQALMVVNQNEVFSLAFLADGVYIIKTPYFSQKLILTQ